MNSWDPLADFLIKFDAMGKPMAPRPMKPSLTGMGMAMMLGRCEEVKERDRWGCNNMALVFSK